MTPQLTGRRFGWDPDADDAARKRAADELAKWWRSNRSKHPVRWPVETVQKEGLEGIDDFNLHVLARWGLAELPLQLINPRMRSRDPEAPWPC